MIKVVGIAAGLLVLFVVVAIASGPSKHAVSKDCRDTVALAAVNVDAWRYISTKCTAAEQDALRVEFAQRGLGTEELDRAKAGK